MRRRPLRPRGGPLRPGAPLTRQHGLRPGAGRLRASAGLPRVNAKRQAKREAEGKVYGEYHDAMARMPCILAGRGGARCYGKVAGHHVVPVARGGEDFGNETPLCAGHHVLGAYAVHVMGDESFDAHWGLSQAALAAEIGRRYESEEW